MLKQNPGIAGPQIPRRLNKYTVFIRQRGTSNKTGKGRRREDGYRNDYVVQAAAENRHNGDGQNDTVLSA